MAVQESLLPEETTDAETELELTHVTALIAVGCWMVRFCVAVNVDCTCEVAVIVITLLVGTLAGAVYRPPELIDPVPVVTAQFTKLLLRLTTVAVHCEVPRMVTSLGMQEMVMVGVTVVLLAPQELRTASAAVNPKKKRRRFQRTLSRPK